MIVLTSAGLGSGIYCRTLLQKIFGAGWAAPAKKVLVIPFARRVENTEFTLGQLCMMGFSAGNITVAAPLLAGQLQTMLFDVIYVEGGNTFRLADCMRRLGLEGCVLNSVAHGADYIGFSAGAHYACESIAAALRWDDNVTELTDFHGLGLVRGVALPHYESARYPDLRELRWDYEQVNVIPEGEAILRCYEPEMPILYQIESLLRGTAPKTLLLSVEQPGTARELALAFRQRLGRQGNSPSLRLADLQNGSAVNRVQEEQNYGIPPEAFLFYFYDGLLPEDLPDVAAAAEYIRRFWDCPLLLFAPGAACATLAGLPGAHKVQWSDYSRAALAQLAAAPPPAAAEQS